MLMPKEYVKRPATRGRRPLSSPKETVTVTFPQGCTALNYGLDGRTVDLSGAKALGLTYVMKTEGPNGDYVLVPGHGTGNEVDVELADGSITTLTTSALEKAAMRSSLAGTGWDTYATSMDSPVTLDEAFKPYRAGFATPKEATYGTVPTRYGALGMDECLKWWRSGEPWPGAEKSWASTIDPLVERIANVLDETCGVDSVVPGEQEMEARWAVLKYPEACAEQLEAKSAELAAQRGPSDVDALDARDAADSIRALFGLERASAPLESTAHMVAVEVRSKDAEGRLRGLAELPGLVFDHERAAEDYMESIDLDGIAWSFADMNGDEVETVVTRLECEPERIERAASRKAVLKGPELEAARTGRTTGATARRNDGKPTPRRGKDKARSALSAAKAAFGKMTRPKQDRAEGKHAHNRR